MEKYWYFTYEIKFSKKGLEIVNSIRTGVYKTGNSVGEVREAENNEFPLRWILDEIIAANNSLIAEKNNDHMYRISEADRKKVSINIFNQHIISRDSYHSFRKLHRLGHY